MNKNVRNKLSISVVVIILIFIVFFIYNEKKVSRYDRLMLEKHALVIKDNIWNFDEEGPREYLKLAAQLCDYTSIIVLVNENHRPLIKLEGITFNFFDKLLSAFKLIFLKELKTDIKYNNEVIGYLKTVKAHRTIYTYLDFIMIAILVIYIIKLILHISNTNQVLEFKVKERTEEFRKSEKKYSDLVSAIPGITFQCKADKDWSFLFISDEIERLTGFKSAEFIDNTRTFASIIHEDDQQYVAEYISTIIKVENVYSLEYRLVSLNKKIIWVHERGIVDKNEDGEITIINGVIIDITRRKNEEEEKEKLVDQLNHSNKLDAIGQLAGGVAHDFNNMLCSIINVAELLSSSKRSLNDKEKGYVDIILKSAVKAADLTAKLLAFGRKNKIASTAIDLHSVINDTEDILKRTIDRKINITVSKSAENSIIIGDDTELQSIFMNLAINAWHAMPDGGNLEIETKNISLDENYCSVSAFDLTPGEYVEITIRDNGSGISPENVKRIFDPFFTTKDLGKGSGLGLATVYGVICQHKGSIVVYSELGEGTAFNIMLPCSKESVQIKPDIKKFFSGSGTILLVDDEELIRISAKAMLNDMGYTVITAENGSEAVEVFKEKAKEIDCIILDMIMPVMNGREAFFYLKEIDPYCKIILSSGFLKDEKISDLKEKGLLSFIQKPFRISELNQTLYNVFNNY